MRHCLTLIAGSSDELNPYPSRTAVAGFPASRPEYPLLMNRFWLRKEQIWRNIFSGVGHPPIVTSLRNGSIYQSRSCAAQRDFGPAPCVNQVRTQIDGGAIGVCAPADP